MSQDQKPRPVKAVTIAGGEAGNMPPQQDGTEQVDANPGRKAASGASLPLLPALLFLIGCILGGAGLAALPHLSPELAEVVYGRHL